MAAKTIYIRLVKLWYLNKRIKAVNNGVASQAAKGVFVYSIWPNVVINIVNHVNMFKETSSVESKRRVCDSEGALKGQFHKKIFSIIYSLSKSV